MTAHGPPRGRPARRHRSSHEHPDVTGGWLRPAVFGAMDGLVSNFALVMGVTGGSDDTKPVLLAGLAGLAAGAFSMAAGEYTSVASQREFALAADRDRAPRDRAERPGRAGRARRDVRRQGPRRGHRARGGGADPPRRRQRRDVTPARSSGSTRPTSPRRGSRPVVVRLFALGAVVPLLPLLFGIEAVWPIVALSLVGLFACGAIVTNLTSRPWWYGGIRQLVLGGAAAGLTYVIGDLVGASLG